MALKFNVTATSVTGRNLARQYETEGGRQAPTSETARGVVCYGAPYRGTKPALNANAGTYDKFRELEMLQNGGVRVPPFSRDGRGLTLPLLARANKHTKGKDIIPVLGPLELTWARRRRDFFTQYLPVATEFRVWVFRNKNIGTYEKIFDRPQQYHQFGCNYENGFSFQHREFSPDTLALAVEALKALGLDFGAVDILKSQDGSLFVLEVNTAPGTEQGVLSRLARRIKEWEEGGCKTRAQEVEHREAARRRRCETCGFFGCLCEARRARRAMACCGKKRCICRKNIR